MRALAVVVVLSGCVTTLPELPTVRLVTWPGQPQLVEYVTGAQAWEAIGFSVIASDTNEIAPDECPRRWYAERVYDCTITVGIKRDPMLVERAGTRALSDRAARAVTIDARVTDEIELTIAVAHEVGHVVLDTSEHTRGGVMGGSTSVLTSVDYALACEAIGVGC